MTTIDEWLVIIALILGILDVISVRWPFSRFSTAGIAIVLLAVVELHRGGILNY